MAVSFNPAFRAEGPISTDNKQSEVKQPISTVPNSPDSIVLAANADKKPKKGGLISGFKNAYANTKKFFINTGYMISGVTKGAVYGTFGGAVVLGVAALKNMVKHNEKTLTTGNKVLAGAVGVAILAGNMIAAKLNANEKDATVDHRWRTGHNDV